MKWPAAPLYLRRLAVRAPHAGIAAAALGPLVDVSVYFAALGLGSTATRAQLLGFLSAAAFVYLPQARVRGEARARPWDVASCLHLLTVTLLAFFLRSGLLALIVTRWGGSASAAIAVAALATAVVLRAGYADCVAFPQWMLGGGAGWRNLAVGSIALSVALRLLYAGQVELLPEETYYWNYAQHLAFGYLDHPPMVGWLIGAGTAAFGDTEFGVRIGAVCCSGLATLYVYRLTSNLFGEPSALVAAVLMQALPFFFMSGLLMTPDAPLTAAWAATLFYLERALIAGRASAWWGAGVCLGLGLLSKYTIAFLGVSTLVFMLLDPLARAWLRRFEPYAAAVLALMLFSPVIVWNAQNGWASFAFQTARRLADSPRFALHKLVGSIIVLLTPVGVTAAAALLGRMPASAPPALDQRPALAQRRAWRFIQVTTGIPLVVFTIFSLRHEVKLDWTGAPWVSALPAMAFVTVHAAQGAAGVGRLAARWIGVAWIPTLCVLFVAYGALFYDLAVGVPGLGYGKHPELVPVGWRELGGAIGGLAGEMRAHGDVTPLVVGMDRYALASELAFYGRDGGNSVRETSSGQLFGQIGLMYERWFPVDQQRGKTLLLVAWDRGDLEGEQVQASVERLGAIHEGALRRGNELIRPYYYRLAYGYRGVAATR